MPEFNGDLLASMTTAPELEKRLKEEIDDVKVTMDFLTARAKAEDAYVKNLRTINQKFLKYKFEDDDDDALAAASTPQKILHGSSLTRTTQTRCRTAPGIWKRSTRLGSPR